MRPLMICLVVFISLVVSAILCLAQDSRVVIYLKNGSVVRGQISELVPDSLVKIETSDGSIFVFKMSEVEKITKEYRKRPTQEVANRNFAGGLNSTSSHFTLLGGLALPVGDFGSTTSGAAKLGFTAGAEYELRLGKYVGWITQFSFCYNPLDEQAMRTTLGLNSSSINLTSTPWLTYSPMTGVKLTGPVSPAFSLFCIGAVGAAFGTSPEINISGPGGAIRQDAASATAFAYSFCAGFVIEEVFRLDVKYISGTPKYDLIIHGAAGGQVVSGMGQYEQATSLILIEAGVEF